MGWIAGALLGLGWLGVVFFGLVRAGKNRWQRETDDLVERLQAAQIPGGAPLSDPSEALPEPVQRYGRRVMGGLLPRMTMVRLEHTGTFNLSEQGEGWKPFRSQQWVSIQRPGFVWDACIPLAAGINLHVLDAYVAGQGVLKAAVGGLLTIVNPPSTPALAQGELMRWLAEAPWYPPVLLTHPGILWQEMDDTQALARLTEGSTTVDLVFTFDADGLIHSVQSSGRSRGVGGESVLTPWRGRFWDYQERSGLLVPTRGEVAWILPTGEKPYWRGQLGAITYA